MLRFHIVTWSNREAYQALLEQYFRLRHDIYVTERKWRQIERPVPLEIDAFDTQHAIYLLGIDDNGAIGGGCRLVPTTCPHLLSDIFPMLAASNPPRAEDIYEWSRFFVSPDLRKIGEPSPAAGMVLCGLLEACLALGISQISVVCEAFWPKRLEQLGWSIERLGKTLGQPDGDILALLIQVNFEALDKTRAAYDLGPQSLLITE
jgi:acyl-homoserine lactone synthase